MTPPNGGDPGGSLGRRLPLFMDPRNEFGRITILQLTGRDGADLPMDPYLIGKSVEQLVGETAIESATSEQRGKRYTLRVRNPTHVEKLLNMSKLMDGTEVCITLHPILNVSKCTIFCSDAIRYTEEEALAKLSAQNVIKVQRITRMENGNRVNTPVLILTFNQTTYPEHVKVGLLYVPTRPFYPNPLLCYNCLNYGHSKVRCPSSKRCHNCSAEYHADQCEQPTFCCNCEGDHRPTNRRCPVYRKEAAVVKLKVDNNLTYHEARRRIEEGNRTYAQATAQPRLDVQKIEALMEENKKKDELITKLLADNKQKDETIQKLFDDLNRKSEQLEILTQKVDNLQASLSTPSIATPGPVKASTSSERSPPRQSKSTARTDRGKLRATRNIKREEKQLRRSKRLLYVSPDSRSPPAKAIRPVTSDTELDSIIEYEEEVVDITDTEILSGDQNSPTQHVADP